MCFVFFRLGLEGFLDEVCSFRFFLEVKFRG